VPSCEFILSNPTVSCGKEKVFSQEAVLIYSSDINTNSLLIDLIQIIYTGIILITEIKICYKIIEMHMQCSARRAFSMMRELKWGLLVSNPCLKLLCLGA
jgi:hypothetical protein